MTTLLPPLLVALWAPVAHAAACCGGISSSDTFVLPRYNKATLGAALSYEDDLANRGSDGQNLGFGAWQSRDARLVLGGAVRLASVLQAGVSAPLVLRNVSLADEASGAVGLGDLGLSGRWEIHDDGSCYMNPVHGWSPEAYKPSIHLIVRATLPTGRSSARDGDWLGASQLGRGYWTGDLGLDVNKVWGVLGADLSGTGGAMTPVSALVGGRTALRWNASAGIQAFFKYKSFVGLSGAHREELGLEGGRLASTDLSASATWYDLKHDMRYLVSAGALGLPLSRSVPVGWQGGLSVSHMF